MRQQQLDKVDYEQWRRDKWVDYASVTLRDERLRWEVNLLGDIVITHGDKVLYRGCEVDKAIQAWNDA